MIVWLRLAAWLGVGSCWLEASVWVSGCGCVCVGGVRVGSGDREGCRCEGGAGDGWG